jgi:hypothetical protein
MKIDVILVINDFGYSTEYFTIMDWKYSWRPQKDEIIFHAMLEHYMPEYLKQSLQDAGNEFDVEIGNIIWTVKLCAWDYDKEDTFILGLELNDDLRKEDINKKLK